LITGGRSVVAALEMSARVARAGANLQTNLGRLVRAWEQAIILTSDARAVMRQCEVLCRVCAQVRRQR